MYAKANVALSGKSPFTDYSRWRLLVSDGGRHTWHYLKTDEECKAWPQNEIDKYWLGLETVCSCSAMFSVLSKAVLGSS